MAPTTTDTPLANRARSQTTVLLAVLSLGLVVGAHPNPVNPNQPALTRYTVTPSEEQRLAETGAPGRRHALAGRIVDGLRQTVGKWQAHQTPPAQPRQSGRGARPQAPRAPPHPSCRRTDVQSRFWPTAESVGCRQPAGRLPRLSAAGGVPAWSDDGSALLRTRRRHLPRVGSGRRARRVDDTHVQHPAAGPIDALPPGGRGLLLTLVEWHPRTGNRLRVVFFHFGSARRAILTGTMARYVPATGHVVYATASGALLVAPFDLTRLEVTGPSVPLVEAGVAGDRRRQNRRQFAVSRRYRERSSISTGIGLGPRNSYG